MRASTTTTVLAASALVLAACTATPGDAPGTPEPSAPAPSTSAATPAPGDPAAALPTDAPADVLLPAGAWGGEGARDEAEGVADWHLPEACADGGPADATAMRTATEGDGAAEGVVGVHQVAVFADADAATAEAARLADLLAACAAQGGAEGTAYTAEPLDVGAQGSGLATDYYGSGGSGDLDTALGTYLATTRRGAAVTLVALDGGESTVGAARETVAEQARAAWELLCRYEQAGC